MTPLATLAMILVGFSSASSNGAASRGGVEPAARGCVEAVRHRVTAPEPDSFADPTPHTPIEPVIETSHYTFHSDPWVNLHHFLYHWARADRGLGTGRQEVVVSERGGALPGGRDGEAWASAVAFYAERIAERGLFDLDMLELKIALVELDGDPSADPPDRITGIAEQLRAVMPVYLAAWWPEHDGVNRTWIAHVADDVRTYEDRWVATVSELFGGAWPERRLRVDASVYGNWAGGYTSNGPEHTVVVSGDPVNMRGLYGLELVFHESGHVRSLARPLRSTVARLFGDAGVEEPGNLQHAILFATAGALTRRIAAERGLPAHVPYVVQEGLVTFDGWASLWPAVRDRWMPLVEDGGDRIAVLRAMANDLR